MTCASSHIPLALDSLIHRGVPLWKHTSVRAGGLARYYAVPERVVEVAPLLQWAERAGYSSVVLGGGTNTLFSDDGYDGLVLDTKRLRGIVDLGESLVVASGQSLASVVDHACHAGLAGLEWAAGIPGTIGGAAAMNAGTRDGDMASVVRRLRLYDRGHDRWVESAGLGYGYRTSAMKEGRLRGVILEVRINLRCGDGAASRARVAGLREERAHRLPKGATFGSIFRNPSTGPTAGELLDRAGCKALRVGQVRVSGEHANILVNEGFGNAAEILELMRRMRARVLAEFGLDLQEEVVVVPPLHVEQPSA